MSGAQSKQIASVVNRQLNAKLLPVSSSLDVSTSASNHGFNMFVLTASL